MDWESSPALIITTPELGETCCLAVPLTSPRITPAATAVETLPAWRTNSRRVMPEGACEPSLSICASHCTASQKKPPLTSGGFSRMSCRRLLPAGVVLGIHVVKLHGRHAMNLDHDFAAGLHIVVHVRIEVGEAARGEAGHAAFVEAISHPHLESSLHDGNVLALGMPMRRNAVSVGHLQADW